MSGRIKSELDELLNFLDAREAATKADHPTEIHRVVYACHGAVPKLLATLGH